MKTIKTLGRVYKKYHYLIIGDVGINEKDNMYIDGCIMILIKPTAAMAETNEKTQQQNFYKQEYLIKQYVRNSDVRLIETIDIGKYNMARSSTRVSDKTYKVSYKKIAALSGDASSGLGLAFLILEKCAITVSNPLVAAVTMCGAVSSVLGHTASNKHGITIKVRTKKYYRTRLGRRQIYKTTRYIVKVGRY